MAMPCRVADRRSHLPHDFYLVSNRLAIPSSSSFLPLLARHISHRIEQLQRVGHRSTRVCVCVCTHTQVRLIYDGGGSIDILATRPNSSASGAEDRYPGCLAVYVDHVARIWPPPEAEFKRLTRAVRRE